MRRVAMRRSVLLTQEQQRILYQANIQYLLRSFVAFLIVGFWVALVVIINAITQ